MCNAQIHRQNQVKSVMNDLVLSSGHPQRHQIIANCDNHHTSRITAAEIYPKRRVAVVTLRRSTTNVAKTVIIIIFKSPLQNVTYKEFECFVHSAV